MPEIAVVQVPLLPELREAIDAAIRAEAEVLNRLDAPTRDLLIETSCAVAERVERAVLFGSGS